MALHENIYRLRTVQNMSQGDLADALDVSRQSISKWENAAAVPEIDKLIKMSQIFGVTLDQLVGANMPQVLTSPPVSGTSSVETDPKSCHTSSVVPGAIFLCVAFIIGLIITLADAPVVGICVSLPFAVCGILCLCLKKHRGLWCCWVLFFAVSFPFHSWVGLGLQPFWSYLPSVFLGSYILAITALFINAITVGMVFWTVGAYAGRVAKSGGKSNMYLLLGWSFSVIPDIFSGVWYGLFSRSFAQNAQQRIYLALQSLSQWTQLTIITYMLVITVGTIRSLRQRSSVIR